MPELKKEALHGVKWSAIGSFANKIILFLIGLVLARLLSPDDYGTVGMTAIFFAIASIFIDSGFSASIIRNKNLTEEDTSTVFFFNIGVSAFCCIILWIFSGTIAVFLKTPILTNIIKVSAISMLIGSLGSVPFCLMTRDVDFKHPAIINIWASIISGSIGIILAYKGFGAWTLVYISLISTVIRISMVWLYTKWRPKLIFSKESFKSMFSFGSNLAFNSILDKFYKEGTGMFIGKFYTPAQLGYYSKAQGLSSLPSNTLYDTVRGVFYPVLSKIQDDDERLFRAYSMSMRVMSMIIFFMMTLLAALAHPIVSFLYSDKWLPCVIFIQIFCFGSMFYHINAINWDLLLVKGRSDWALRKEIINKSFDFGFLAVGIAFGPVAVAIALTAAAWVNVIVNMIVAGKLFDFGVKRQCADFLPFLALSIITCIPSYLIALIPTFPIVTIIGGIFASSILYFGFLWITKNKSLASLIEMTPLKKMIPLRK